jgi:hypothetical protein
MNARSTTAMTAFVGSAIWGVAVLAAPPVSQTATMSALITVVTNASGPATNLTAKDFTVHSGKQALQVTAADHATQPLSIELLVDNSQPQGMAGAMADLRIGLDTFVKVIRAGESDAQIGMYTFAGQAIPMVKLNAPAPDLDQAISHLFLIQEPSGALLEAIEDASRDLGERPAPRRAIVSVDFASAEATPDTAVPGVGPAVARCGASVWAVSVADLTRESQKREVVLGAVIPRSGGLRISIVRSSGLPSQLKAIASSLLSQYAIQFARPAGELEELKIETPKGRALATMFAI